MSRPSARRTAKANKRRRDFLKKKHTATGITLRTNGVGMGGQPVLASRPAGLPKSRKHAPSRADRAEKAKQSERVINSIAG